MCFLINESFGGFSLNDAILSKKGILPPLEQMEEYMLILKRYNHAKMRDENPEIPDLIKQYPDLSDYELRSHPALIEAVINQEHISRSEEDSIILVEFDDAFKDYFYIHEYDGAESIVFQFDKLILAELNCLNGVLSTAEDLANWKQWAEGTKEKTVARESKGSEEGWDRYTFYPKGKVCEGECKYC